jgi:hypothetical protein
MTVNKKKNTIRKDNSKREVFKMQLLISELNAINQKYCAGNQ